MKEFEKINVFKTRSSKIINRKFCRKKLISKLSGKGKQKTLNTILFLDIFIFNLLVYQTNPIKRSLRRPVKG